MLISYNEMLGFLATFIVVCLGIAVLVLLIIALVNLIKTIRKVNKILDNNTESIEKTAKKLPQLIESIDKTLISVGEASDGVRDVFFDTRPYSDTAATIVNIVESVANMVISFRSKKK